jgi:opacity protein-like surface antigen
MNAQPLRRGITRRLPTLWIAALLALACCSTALAAANASSAHHHKKPKSKLAGKWKGHYSGAVSGHFTIHWTQSGRKLSGTIKLSNPKGKYGIDGSIRAHKKLKFGAVSVGAKYKGVWSGSTMSGTWTSPQGGGSWSAHKA